MFRGFDINLDDWKKQEQEACLGVGQELYANNLRAVKQTLEAFLRPNGKLDGAAVRQHWFPQIEVDIFISHSHKDRDLAISLAGLLHKYFGLKSFIDSCVWGWTGDLLKDIDDKYCINEDRASYSYERRNGSTSHVHMMLITALTMMIDRAECALFLNTPNSLTSEEAAKTSTASPWIFAEIGVIRMIHPKYPREIKKADFSKHLAEADLQVDYQLDLSSFAKINTDTLIKWKTELQGSREHALDVLYSIVPTEE